MSVTPVEKKQTPAALRARKGGTPIVSLTAYTASQARILDPHCDLFWSAIPSAWWFMASTARCQSPWT